MAEVLISAAAGLVGVLVGAGLTVWAERTRIAEQATIAVRTDRRAAQVAARLVLADARRTRSRLRLALDKHKTWSPTFRLPQDAWSKHRETLAAHLSLDGWEQLALFWETVQRLESQAGDARSSTGKHRPDLSEFRATQAQLGITRADEVIQLLGDFAYDGAYADPAELLSTEEDEVDEAGEAGTTGVATSTS